MVYTKGDPSNPKHKLIYVPEKLRLDLLGRSHGDSISGHLGADKVWQELRHKFYWPHMYNDIIAYVKSCDICQSRNIPTTKAPGLLIPIRTSNIFETIGIDFVSGLPITQASKFKHILVAVDLYTKFLICKPTRDMSAQTVAHFLVYDVFLRYGFPSRLLSDRGANFLSTTVKEILDLLNIMKVNTTAYHPQCDGNSEACVKNVIQLLAKSAQTESHRWDQYLPFVVYQYNTNYHSSIKTSPYTAVHGVNPRSFHFSFPEFNQHGPHVSILDHVKHGFTNVRNYVTEQLDKAHDRQKVNYDKSRQHVEYKLGDYVMVKEVRIKPRAHKLFPRYLGPYIIVGQINTVTYRVRILPSLREESFHVSRLKHYNFPVTSSELPSMSSCLPSHKLNNSSDSIIAVVDDPLPLNDLNQNVSQSHVNSNINSSNLIHLNKTISSFSSPTVIPSVVPVHGNDLNDGDDEENWYLYEGHVDENSKVDQHSREVITEVLDSIPEVVDLHDGGNVVVDPLLNNSVQNLSDDVFMDTLDSPEELSSFMQRNRIPGVSDDDMNSIIQMYSDLAKSPTLDDFFSDFSTSEEELNTSEARITRRDEILRKKALRAFQRRSEYDLRSAAIRQRSRSLRRNVSSSSEDEVFFKNNNTHPGVSSYPCADLNIRNVTFRRKQ